MKKLIWIAGAALCLAAWAKPGDAAKKGPAELKTQAEAVYKPDVVALLEAKYWRDISNETGRAFWHGKRVSAVADPSNMVSYAVFEDGRVFKDKAKITTPAEAVAAANKKLPRTVDTKGVPKKLAEARKRREAEMNGAVSNVTVNVTAGGHRCEK